MKYIDPAKVFEKEIACFTSDWHKGCFLIAINNAPDYFWVVPSSTSGKYHPEADLGIGGNVRHTKAVFWVGEEMLRNTLLFPFDEETQNDIRVAMLLHDSIKMGLGDTIEHTVHNHPMLVRENLCPYNPLTEDVPVEDTERWGRICDLIESHMGMWNTKNKKPGIQYTPADNVVLPIPDTDAKKFVHLADYIASRKRISVSLENGDAPISKPKTDWRTLPAKDTQLSYIQNLVNQCIRENRLDKSLGNSINAQSMTRGEASDLIQKLLDLLK